jgi:hypothetical protein
MYVFDNGSLRRLCENYYPARFPSLWERFDKLVSTGKVVSVREVYKEIERWNPSRKLVQWAEDHKDLFASSSPEELEFVSQVFRVEHFQMLIKRESILQGTPVADPFVIAKAKIQGGIVVTEESFKENAARIPNVCQYFQIPCIDLEGFMEKEGWQF